MGKRGPSKIIDKKKLASLMRMKPSLADTAAFFECSDQTVMNFIRTEFDMTFLEFRERHIVSCRHDLVREALSISLSKKNVFGKTDMLKFALKNIANWAEKTEVTGEDGGDIVVKVKWADEDDKDPNAANAATDPTTKKD